MTEKLELTDENIWMAVEKLKRHKLGARLDKVDGSESWQILPEIWPVIQEIRLLTDACEAGRILFTI
jgi:hypothetical protein